MFRHDTHFSNGSVPDFSARHRDQDLREHLQKLSEEGAAFRSERQVILLSDIDSLVKVDAEIGKLKNELSLKFGKLGTTQSYEKQQDVERSKLNTMEARRVLLQQDHEREYGEWRSARCKDPLGIHAART